MKFRKPLSGFTLVELLVVISIIALLLSIMMPALRSAREKAMRVVCNSGLRTLSIAWTVYSEDNSGKLVPGWTAPASGWSLTTGWIWYRPSKNSPSCWPEDFTREEHELGITRGLLYRYVNDLDVYRCPTAKRDVGISYAISRSMHGDPEGSRIFDVGTGIDITNMTYTRLMNIKKPSEKLVFVDEDIPSSGSYALPYGQSSWWDRPSLMHGIGTTFSFADLHTEWWPWRDPRTIALAKRRWSDGTGVWDATPQPNNSDIERVQRGMWGRIGY